MPNVFNEISKSIWGPIPNPKALPLKMEFFYT